MSKHAELDAFLADNPQIELFEVLLCDLGGRLRGKWLPTEHITKVFEGGFKLPVTAVSLDAWGRDIEELVFEKGDEDGICLAQPDSLSAVPWLARPTGQLLVSMDSSCCVLQASKLSNPTAWALSFYLAQDYVCVVPFGVGIDAELENTRASSCSCTQCCR